MLYTGFREVNVDVGSECTQIIQIMDNNRNTCYEIVKHLETGELILHYNKTNNSVMKQFIDSDISLYKAIEAIGLDPRQFKFDDYFNSHSVENMLESKVTDLPLLAGHSIPI